MANETGRLLQRLVKDRQKWRKEDNPYPGRLGCSLGFDIDEDGEVSWYVMGDEDLWLSVGAKTPNQALKEALGIRTKTHLT